MAEKENYIINIQGELVEVSPDIYQLYFRMERQERNQVETSQRHEVSYDALDNEESVGVFCYRAGCCRTPGKGSGCGCCRVHPEKLAG